MNIQIGKYVLTSDSFQFILAETYIAQSGKMKGQQIEKRSTFHPTLEGALNEIWRREIRASDATTLKDLLEEMKDIKKQILEFLPTDIDKTSLSGL